MYQKTRRVVGSTPFVIGSTAVAGLAGVVISLFVSNPFTKVVPPLVLLGVVVGYGIRNEEITLDELALEDSVLKQQLLLSSYCLVAASAIGWFVSNGFRRTIGVYGLLLLLSLLVVLSIVVVDSRQLNFGLVVVTGILYRAMVYYGSAVQIGMDALFHNRMAEAIASTGSLSPLGTSKYWYAPVYHLLTASGITVLGVDVRHAAFLLVTAVTTLLLVGAVYLFLEPIWGSTIALVGTLFVVVADRAIFTAIHTTTTSIGVVFFAFLLVYAERYLDTGRRLFLALYLLFLGGLVFTHQLSLFIALVVVGVYIWMNLFWEHNTAWRGITLFFVLVVAFVVQAISTSYSGPDSDSSSFLTVVGSVMVTHLRSIFEGSSSRATAELPPGEYIALAGADSMSEFDVVGAALLIGLALAGSIYWIHQNDDEMNRTVLGLGAGSAVACVFIYVLPTLGMSLFLPDRWQVFLYVVLAILAAPGLAAVLSQARRRTQRATIVIVVAILVFAPYTAVMIGNSAGAADDPVFDTAPGAARLATTAEEKQLYEFTVTHADADTTIVADKVAFQLLSRHYEQPAVTYETTYGEQGSPISGDQLVVYRAYAQTRHGSYYIAYEDTRYQVYGPLPGPYTEDSIVYTNGQDQLIWRGASSSESNQA